jgi:hypothetical protein
MSSDLNSKIFTAPLDLNDSIAEFEFYLKNLNPVMSNLLTTSYIIFLKIIYLYRIGG